MKKDVMIMKKMMRRSVPAVFMTGVLLTASVLTGCGKGEGISRGMITTVTTGDYTEKFTAEGTVECAEPHYVYSTLSLPVEEVLVKEGDYVTAGTLLCVLDTKTIEDKIAVKQAAIELYEKKASTNVSAARTQYNIYNESLASGTDVNLVEAFAKMEAARETYESAQKTYDDYKESVSMGMDPALASADQSVARAANSLQQAKSWQYELDDTHGVSKLEKEEAEDAVDSASLAYVQAIENRDNLLRQSDIKLADYAKLAEDANYNYIIAQTAYTAAVKSLENAKTLSQAAINQAMINGDMTVEELELAQLNDQLLDAQVIAECSGMVTAVNVNVGEASTGVLFVIEDTSDLIFTAKVSEKEINSVSEGMAVSVSTKAENSEDYTGTVQRVAAYTEKTADGETDTSGKDAEFNVTILLEEPDENVRIGMNGKASFIAYEQPEGLAVPNEAVYTDTDGKKYVLTISSDTESGTIEKKEVTVNYKGKRESSVESASLHSGDHVLVDAATYWDLIGENVTITQ